ncbi:hypothetical protein GGI22_005946 [Coemansia erecta]|nr:hypothetical protein GGI22_005946 [Coemansia erecta]
MEHSQATSSADRTADDNQQGEQDADNTYVAALSDSTVAIGASLQNMQQVLMGNMQQVAQMTLSMNTMMEEMVRRAISIGVFAEASSSCCSNSTTAPGEDKYSAVLRISVANSSPIPLINMKASLRFAQRKSDSAQSIRIASTPVRMPAPGTPETNGRRKISIEFAPLDATTLLPANSASAQDDGGSSAAQQESNPASVASGATAEASVRLSASALKQMDGQITATFISPGTGTPLSVSHRFGVHLLHLTANQRCFIAAKDVARKLGGRAIEAIDSQSSGSSFDLTYLRNAFVVPPADGIDVGSVFVLLADGNGAVVLGLRVSSINARSHHAECTWIGEPERGGVLDQTTLDIIPLFAKEIASRIY